MYNSKYYTCEQIDQRLLQGYFDDIVAAGYTGTKAQYLEGLLKAINYVANPYIAADKVIYDHAISSGLTSKNVQEAIDEIVKRTQKIKGVISVGDNLDLKKETSDIGLWFLNRSADAGIVLVCFDYQKNCVQVKLSATRNESIHETIAKPSVQYRKYIDKAWTKWTDIEFDALKVKSLEIDGVSLEDYIKVVTKPELAMKFDKVSVVQELGEAEDKVISQKLVTSHVNNVMSKTDFNLAMSSSFLRTNLCNQNAPDFKDGYFITPTGGLQANEAVVTTGFIFFTKEMESLVCSVNGKLNTWNNIYIALYDINKNFISAKPANKNVVWQEGVAFARFSLQKSSTGLNHYQVEVGTEPTPYIEYGKADIKDIVKVTEKNIATGSVTSEKIAEGAITKDKLSPEILEENMIEKITEEEITEIVGG